MYLPLFCIAGRRGIEHLRRDDGQQAFALPIAIERGGESMKVTAVGIAVIAAVVVVSPASAADVSPYPYAPPVYSGYSWLGPFVALTLGGQWGSVTNSPAKSVGVEGGLEGGYNWQSGQFVYGIAGDLQGSSANDRFAAYQFSNPWFGTVRARGGIAFNNILIYGTLGPAIGEGEFKFGGLSESTTHLGWTAGLGFEVGLTPNWSAKVEYLFVDLANQNYLLTGSTGFQSNILRLGVSYRF
jgi:outer membrane immunogenic protein